MLDTLDVAISKKEQELAATFLKGNRSIDDIIDSGDEAIRMSPSGQALPPPSAAEINDVRQGLDLLAKANKHYKDGADIINNGLLDSITIAIKGKHAADISAVVQQVVLPNQPNKLKAVLDAVTPDVKQVDDLIEAGRANPNFSLL